MKRHQMIEHIAREICWREFSPVYRRFKIDTGISKAQYWKEISDRARTECRREAERFCWTLATLPPKTLDLARAAQRLGSGGE